MPPLPRPATKVVRSSAREDNRGVAPEVAMDRSPQGHEPPRFRPGLSPFHIKGTGYRGHLEYAEKSIPGGQAAVIAALDDPELREFFAQPFLASSWYDVMPMLPLGAACAKIVRMSLDEFLRFRTRLQVEADIRGVYKLMLELASVESVALRIPRIVSTYFDFGTVEAKLVKPGHIEATRTGIPASLLPWHNPVVETYIERVLQCAGARDVKVGVEGTARDGLVEDVRTVAVRYSLKWRVRGT
jgi:hypothetical protein